MPALPKSSRGRHGGLRLVATGRGRCFSEISRRMRSSDLKIVRPRHFYKLRSLLVFTVVIIAV